MAAIVYFDERLLALKAVARPVGHGGTIAKERRLRPALFLCDVARKHAAFNKNDPRRRALNL
jgi:hypothetical protein